MITKQQAVEMVFDQYNLKSFRVQREETMRTNNYEEKTESPQTRIEQLHTWEMDDNSTYQVTYMNKVKSWME